MFAVTVRTIGPIEDDAPTYLGADIDEAWEGHGGIHYATLLVPRQQIDATYTVKKHVEHHEVHGANKYVSQYELEIHDCYWVGNGHCHKVVNDQAVCWEVEDYDNA
jgi:hypothetical protein